MRDDITVNVSAPQYRVHLVGRWSSFTGIAAVPDHADPCRTETDDHFSCGLPMTAILTQEISSETDVVCL